MLWTNRRPRWPAPLCSFILSVLWFYVLQTIEVKVKHMVKLSLQVKVQTGCGFIHRGWSLLDSVSFLVKFVCFIAWGAAVKWDALNSESRKLKAHRDQLCFRFFMSLLINDLNTTKKKIKLSQFKFTLNCNRPSLCLGFCCTVGDISTAELLEFQHRYSSSSCDATMRHYVDAHCDCGDGPMHGSRSGSCRGKFFTF